MNQPDVSIIIVNYHTSDQIIDCVKSIELFTSEVTYEIVIIDNNSEPEISEKFNNFKCVKIINLDENIGFGRANNVGFRNSKGRYIFCLNPDTVLLNNAIKILVSFMDSHEDVGACGGNIFDSSMKPGLSFRRIMPGIKWELNEFLNLKPEKFIFGKNRIFNFDNEALEVGYITGADLMIRRELLTSVSGYNPAFFMYYEETDLCLRIRKNGWKIYSVPEARIQHLEGGSFNDTDGIHFNRIERSENGRVTYYNENKNLVTRTLCNTIYLATLITRSILLRPSTKRDSWRFRLKLFYKHVFKII